MVKNLSELDSKVFKALKLISDDNYIEAEEILTQILKNKDSDSHLTSFQYECIANMLLLYGKFQAALEAYKNAKNFAGASFTLILLNEPEEAELILRDVNKSPAFYWCQFLIDLFVNGYIKKHYPSFFQIRHFLEMTVYHLLLAHRVEVVELLISNLDELLKINLDAEKLIGFAFYSYGNLDRAIHLLKNSLQRDQYDGEIYFKLGQIYLSKNDLHDAMSMFSSAQLLLPGHYPTKMLLEKIKILI